MVSWSHVRFPALIALAIQSGMASCIRGEEPPPQGPDGKDVRCPAGHLQSPATRPLRAHSSFAHAVSLSTAGRGGPEPRHTLGPRRRGFPQHRESPPTLGPRFACVGSGFLGTRILECRGPDQDTTRSDHKQAWFYNFTYKLGLTSLVSHTSLDSKLVFLIVEHNLTTCSSQTWQLVFLIW